MYNKAIKVFRQAIRAYCLATGISREEAIEILLPAIVRRFEQALRDSVNQKRQPTPYERYLEVR